MTIEFPENATIGDLLDPAMKITDQEEADVYFEALVAYGMTTAPEISRKDAEARMREYLGYHAGYHSRETRLRVERLFKCVHPIFGSAEKEVASPKEIFEQGKLMAQVLGLLPELKPFAADVLQWAFGGKGPGLQTGCVDIDPFSWTEEEDGTMRLWGPPADTGNDTVGAHLAEKGLIDGHEVGDFHSWCLTDLGRVAAQFLANSEANA